MSHMPIFWSWRRIFAALVTVTLLQLAGCGPSIKYEQAEDPLSGLKFESKDARSKANTVTLCYLSGEPQGEEMQALALEACRGNGPVTLVSDDGVAGTCPISAPFAATYQCGPDPGRRIVR